MRRQLSLRAEVLARLDDADAEQFLPERLTATRAVSGLSGLTSQRPEIDDQYSVAWAPA